MTHHRAEEPAEEAVHDRCAWCQDAWEPGDGPTWLHVDIERGVPDSDVLMVSFCSQEHAALWFQQPLPPPAETSEVGVRPMGADIATYFLIFGAVSAVLMIIGLVTVIGWLL